MSDFNWLEELENPQDFFNEDWKNIINESGIKFIISVYNNFGGASVYFNISELEKAMKQYIRLNYNGDNHHKVRNELGIKETKYKRLLNEVLKEKK